MIKLIRLASVALLVLQASPVSAVPAPQCEGGRGAFERWVGTRMLTYASTGDSWSPRARKWASTLGENVEGGRPTPDLDATYGRFRRYCDEGDTFMAGLVMGEWIGLALRAP